MKKALLLLLLPVMAFAQLGGNDDVFGDNGFKTVIWINGSLASALGICNAEEVDRCLHRSGNTVDEYEKNAQGQWVKVGTATYAQVEDPSLTQCGPGSAGICLIPGSVWAGTQWNSMHAWSQPGVGGCANTVWGCNPIF